MEITETDHKVEPEASGLLQRLHDFDHSASSRTALQEEFSRVQSRMQSHSKAANAREGEDHQAISLSGLQDDVIKYTIGTVYTEDTAKDLLSGAYKEVTEHPWKIGFTVAGAGAINTVLRAFLGPKANMVILGVGAIAGAYELGKTAYNLALETAVLKDPNSSAAAKEAAHKAMSDTGAAGAYTFAATIGGALSTEATRLASVYAGIIEETNLPTLGKTQLKVGALLASYEATLVDLYGHTFAHKPTAIPAKIAPTETAPTKIAPTRTAATEI